MDLYSRAVNARLFNHTVLRVRFSIGPGTFRSGNFLNLRRIKLLILVLVSLFHRAFNRSRQSFTDAEFASLLALFPFIVILDVYY